MEFFAPLRSPFDVDNIFTGVTLFGSSADAMALSDSWRPRRSWVIGVEGFDTWVPKDDMKKALMNHFGSCGSILDVCFSRHPVTDVVDSYASVYMAGDDADEKSLELNGSELAGRKLVVKAEPYPELKLLDVPFGHGGVESSRPTSL